MAAIYSVGKPLIIKAPYSIAYGQVVSGYHWINRYLLLYPRSIECMI